MPDQEKNIIIYRTADGNASVALLAKDGKIWLNQQQMAELFATSKQTISYHIINILKENELTESSVVKEYLTTAVDGKSYNIIFYSLEMIIAVGYRVRGVRGSRRPNSFSFLADSYLKLKTNCYLCNEDWYENHTNW